MLTGHYLSQGKEHIYITFDIGFVVTLFPKLEFSSAQPLF